MLSYKRATPEQYDEFMQLMQAEAADYLESTLSLMQMTLAEMQHLFQTVGQVHGIYQDGVVAGFYWIEARGRTLHLHGLILKQAFQRQGIGTAVLKQLEADYLGRVETIELGVHQANAGARALYEKLGYLSVKHLEALGFYIMQKPLA